MYVYLPDTTQNAKASICLRSSGRSEASKSSLGFTDVDNSGPAFLVFLGLICPQYINNALCPIPATEQRYDRIR